MQKIHKENPQATRRAGQALELIKSIKGKLSSGGLDKLAKALDTVTRDKVRPAVRDRAYVKLKELIGGLSQSEQSRFNQVIAKIGLPSRGPDWQPES